MLTHGAGGASGSRGSRPRASDASELASSKFMCVGDLGL